MSIEENSLIQLATLLKAFVISEVQQGPFQGIVWRGLQISPTLLIPLK